MPNKQAADVPRSVLGGLAAGLIGGLVGSWVMNQVQALLDERPQEAGDGNGNSHHGWLGKNDPESLPIAAAVSEQVFHHTLTRQQERPAATTVHYVFGTALGGVYGVMAETMPATGTALGAPFGAALWAGAEKVALPMMGLSNGLSQRTMAGQGKDLLAHVIYGVTTDLVRRGVRRALGRK